MAGLAARWIALSCALVLTSSARAETTPAYAEGKAALIDHRYGEAQAAFERALAEAATPPERWRALLGLGLVAELAAELEPAVARYRSFLAEAIGPGAQIDPWPERRAEVAASARRLEGELLKRYGLVTVLTDPAEAEVLFLREGSTLPSAPEPRRRFLPPGDFLVEARHPGHETATRALTVAVGADTVLELRLAAAPPEVEPTPTDMVTASQDPPGSSDATIPLTDVPPTLTRRADPGAGPWPAIAFATGSGLVVGGVVMHLLALGDQGELEDLSKRAGTSEVMTRFDRVEGRLRDRETAAWVMYGVGVGAIGTGLFLLLTAPSDGAVTLDVAPQATGAAARLHARF